jgi:hypothetical protein
MNATNKTIATCLIPSLLLASGCLGQPGEDLESQTARLDDYDWQEHQDCERAGGQYNLISHYRYSDSSGNYTWKVTGNVTTDRAYVDERRIGGGFYRQYRLNYWDHCLFLPQTITLRYGQTVLTGTHDCIASQSGAIVAEEVHLQDKQRLLFPADPAVTTECYF